MVLPEKEMIWLVFSIWLIVRVKGVASLVPSETVLVGQNVGLCFTKHANYQQGLIINIVIKNHDLKIELFQKMYQLGKI